jgi:hypothetical protein
MGTANDQSTLTLQAISSAMNFKTTSIERGCSIELTSALKGQVDAKPLIGFASSNN